MKTRGPGSVIIDSHLNEGEITWAVANLASDRYNERFALGFVTVARQD